MMKIARTSLVICALFGAVQLVKADTWPMPDPDDGSVAVSAVQPVQADTWPMPDPDDGSLMVTAVHSSSMSSGR